MKREILLYFCQKYDHIPWLCCIPDIYSCLVCSKLPVQRGCLQCVPLLGSGSHYCGLAWITFYSGVKLILSSSQLLVLSISHCYCLSFRWTFSSFYSAATSDAIPKRQVIFPGCLCPPASFSFHAFYTLITFWLIWMWSLLKAQMQLFL